MATAYSQQLTTYALVLLYSVAVPLILPFGACFILSTLLVDRYQIRIGPSLAPTARQTAAVLPLSVTRLMWWYTALFLFMMSSYFFVSPSSDTDWVYVDGAILLVLFFLLLLWIMIHESRRALSPLPLPNIDLPPAIKQLLRAGSLSTISIASDQSSQQQQLLEQHQKTAYQPPIESALEQLYQGELLRKSKPSSARAPHALDDPQQPPPHNEADVLPPDQKL